MMSHNFPSCKVWYAVDTSSLGSSPRTYIHQDKLAFRPPLRTGTIASSLDPVRSYLWRFCLDYFGYVMLVPVERSNAAFRPRRNRADNDYISHSVSPRQCQRRLIVLHGHSTQVKRNLWIKADKFGCTSL